MDIRLPMGLMFVIIGLVIMFFGMATTNDPMYKATSDGININLIWGAVLAGFGVLMLVLTWLARPKKA